MCYNNNIHKGEKWSIHGNSDIDLVDKSVWNNIFKGNMFI